MFLGTQMRLSAKSLLRQKNERKMNKHTQASKEPGHRRQLSQKAMQVRPAPSITEALEPRVKRPEGQPQLADKVLRYPPRASSTNPLTPEERDGPDSSLKPLPDSMTAVLKGWSWNA